MGYAAEVPVKYFNGGDIVVIGSKVYKLERTCKNTFSEDRFICSECKAEVFAVTYYENADVSVYVNDDEVGIKFCPACGARVIN